MNILKPKTKKSGCIVYMVSIDGVWMEYTSLNQPVTVEMGMSLAEHLRRNHTGGQVIETPSGKKLAEWEANSSEIRKQL
jgi:hypothetical protein